MINLFEHAKLISIQSENNLLKREVKFHWKCERLFTSFTEVELVSQGVGDLSWVSGLWGFVSQYLAQSLSSAEFASLICAYIGTCIFRNIGQVQLAPSSLTLICQMRECHSLNLSNVLHVPSSFSNFRTQFDDILDAFSRAEWTKKNNVSSSFLSRTS